MKALVDADLIIEFLLNREFFVRDTQRFIDFLFSQDSECFILEHGFNRIRDHIKILILNEEDNNSDVTINIAVNKISSILEVVRISDISRNTVQQARFFNIEDYESALEIAVAIVHNFDAIITHVPQTYNKFDFTILIFP